MLCRSRRAGSEKCQKRPRRVAKDLSNQFYLSGGRRRCRRRWQDAGRVQDALAPSGASASLRSLPENRIVQDLAPPGELFLHELAELLGRIGDRNLGADAREELLEFFGMRHRLQDRKSTRLNSSHSCASRTPSYDWTKNKSIIINA